MSSVSLPAGAVVAVVGGLFLLAGNAVGLSLGALFLAAGAAALFFGYGDRLNRYWAWGAGALNGILFIVVGTVYGYVSPVLGAAAIIYGTFVIAHIARNDVKERLRGSARQ